MKVVINRCWGGFSISKEAAEFMAARGNKQAKAEIEEWKSKINGRVKNPKWYGYGYIEGFDGGYSRTDPDLVAAVESLGNEANGNLSKLVVVEIPDGIDWEIDDYDGMETIEEKHRSWY